MTLFRREQRADHPSDQLGELYMRRRYPQSTAGQYVDPATAMRLADVWACVDLIAGMVSTMPVDEFKKTPDGGHIELDVASWMVSPDGELGLTGWLYQVLESLLKRGNAYGLILSRDREGWPSAIKMVNPDCVQVRQRGEPLGPAEFKIEGTTVRRYDPKSGMGDLWHVPAYVVAGFPVGLSPIEYGALTIGIGLAAQEFGGNWFRDGAVPSALLTNDAEVPKGLADLAKQRWMDTVHGTREPVVLGNGWKYQAVAVAPNESQFLETLQATTEQVARFFRVPPTEIGATVRGDSMTYKNIEHRGIALLTYTLNPWMIRLEEALGGLRPRGHYFKFNPDALLRVDLRTRYEAHDMATRSGWRSVNEIRHIEDLDGIGPDGDRFLWPPLRQQLTEEELGTGDEIEGGVDADENEQDEPVSVNGRGG